MTEQVIVVPDIGTDDKVNVIEINVNIGDEVKEEDTLVTLESEKASMEIPAPISGIVANIAISVGDKIKTGMPIMTFTTVQTSSKVETTQQVLDNNVDLKVLEPRIMEVKVPDIGTDNKVVVIEVLAKAGDSVDAEDSLITLESEKASMDVPSPKKGLIKEVIAKVGDKIGEGDLIALLEIVESSDELGAVVAIKESSPSPTYIAPIEDDKSLKSSVSPNKEINEQEINKFITNAAGNKHIYASPSIRRFANDLGVDLSRITGSGRKNRILQVDVENYVKTQLAKVQSGESTYSSGSGIGLNIIPLPEIDHSKFGEITEIPLSRIKKISAANLHRNWVMVPHVTQFDEADITDMEDFRKKYKKQAEDKGYKLTPLVFLMRAAAQALKLMPQFNVSLSNDGQKLIQKNYFHIGIAVDTPNGLVVPVIRDVDQKGLFQLSQELADVSNKAREGKLQAKDMQGGCFTISSLGGIGGTAFTPIVNVPDIAILGISKSQIKPIYQNGEFVPRLMLPLSLSYDHRAIDGADAARFITTYSKLLGDISQLLL